MNNTLRAYSALGKREIWEHKSFWIVPAVIGCLAILFALYGGGALLITAHQNMININNHLDFTYVDRGQVVRAFIIGSASLFNTVMLFMVWFYLMDSLYADRKDRSVLFWKSMPISDTSTVLSKLFTGMVTAPALMLAAVIATEILVGILAIILFSLLGVNLLPLAFQPGTIILAWITLAFALIVQSLWLLPFFGWFLLCSAWARKLVLAWAVLIPLGAMLVERLFIGTHYLTKAIFGHLAKLFTMVMSGHYTVNGVTIGSGIEFGGKSEVAANHSPLMTFGSLMYVFVQPEMWIGIAIGAIFVFGAIWLRRNRSEI
jgi:ABC-2 type transport system permease protein